MGGKSKPPMPPPDPMEIALGEIGMELYNEYETTYKPMNEKLLGMASVDRSDQAAGRSTVDAQKAVSDQLAGSILRGASTGGFGGAGSISLVDAGATGGALASAGSAGYQAGQNNYVNRLSKTVGAVQDGQDVSMQGLRNAGQIASSQALDSYKHQQEMKNINSSGLAQVVGAAGKGYLQKQSLDRQQANLDAMQKTANASQQGANSLGTFNQNFFDLYAPPRRQSA